jgi:DNA-binding NarL/FixJ family response regulator
MKITVDMKEKSIELPASTLRSHAEYVEYIEGVLAQVTLLWGEEHAAYLESGDDGEVDGDAAPPAVAPPDKGQEGCASPDEREARLQPRQKDVLRLYREGLSRQAIADRLCITLANVDTIKSSVRKLGLIP